MAYFPLFVNLESETILVVGAGTIAQRRAKTILPFAANVTVVAKEVPEAFERFLTSEENAGRAVIRKRAFEDGDLDGAFLVLACTDDAALNREIVEKSRARGIPANNCSDKENCDFFFPGLIYRDPFVVGFTAGGKAHGLVRAIREKTEEVIDEVIQQYEFTDEGEKPCQRAENR